MTPAEAFALLRERRIGEITKGRPVEELSTLELAECLRLRGCRMPRFEGDEYAATMAVYDWMGTPEGAREITQMQTLQEKGNGTVPLSVDGRR
jgi:hypothetical protein